MTDFQTRRCIRSGWYPRDVNDGRKIVGVLKYRLIFGVPIRHGSLHIAKLRIKKIMYDIFDVYGS